MYVFGLNGADRWDVECLSNINDLYWLSKLLFSHLKLCLANATHNFKWLRITDINKVGRVIGNIIFFLINFFIYWNIFIQGGDYLYMCPVVKLYTSLRT